MVKLDKSDVVMLCLQCFFYNFAMASAAWSLLENVNVSLIFLSFAAMIGFMFCIDMHKKTEGGKYALDLKQHVF